MWRPDLDGVVREGHSEEVTFKLQLKGRVELPAKRVAGGGWRNIGAKSYHLSNPTSVSRPVWSLPALKFSSQDMNSE